MSITYFHRSHARENVLCCSNGRWGGNGGLKRCCEHVMWWGGDLNLTTLSAWRGGISFVDLRHMVFNDVITTCTCLLTNFTQLLFGNSGSLELHLYQFPCAGKRSQNTQTSCPIYVKLYSLQLCHVLRGWYAVGGACWTLHTEPWKWWRQKPTLHICTCSSTSHKGSRPKSLWSLSEGEHVRR